MANNGDGRDTTLLKKMIHSGKLLTVNEEDSDLLKLIKTKLNTVVLEDKTHNERYLKHRYVAHSAWFRIEQTVTVINKLRQQNWFWDYITLN